MQQIKSPDDKGVKVRVSTLENRGCFTKYIPCVLISKKHSTLNIHRPSFLTGSSIFMIQHGQDKKNYFPEHLLKKRGSYHSGSLAEAWIKSRNTS